MPSDRGGWGMEVLAGQLCTQPSSVSKENRENGLGKATVSLPPAGCVFLFTIYKRMHN